MTTKTEQVATEAAAEYIRRRDRLTNPEGEFDNGGRFYLADSERRGCCGPIRTPSRAYPYSEMVHARTAAHVAALFGIEAKLVRREARRLDQQGGDDG
jgi:hypothetical protein